MVAFTPKHTEPEKQRHFDDDDKLPLHEATVPVNRRKSQIVEFLLVRGANTPTIVEGHVGDQRPAFRLTFGWREQQVKMIVAALPFKRRQPTDRMKEQARRQAIGALYEYLRFTLSIRHFMPEFEPFAGYMLYPGSNDTIGAAVHRLLDGQGTLALPEPPPSERPFVEGEFSEV
jgi:hypothetical protein